MKYKYEYYKLNNGIEEVSIVFEEKYELLTTFFSCDVTPFEDNIRQRFEKVIHGISSYEEFNGNVCCAEIYNNTTKIYDNLAEDGMGNWCEIDTCKLYALINEWCEKIKEIKN